MEVQFEKVKYSSQRCLQSFPAVVVGSGYSAAYGLPTVSQLSDYLIENIQLDNNEAEQWKRIAISLQTENLEVALSQNGVLEPLLLKKIIDLTWQQIVDCDLKAKISFIKEPQNNALFRLLNYLFSSSNETLSIVTTNYDLLCEYAISSYGGMHSTGFMPGAIGNRDDGYATTYYRGKFPLRTVNLWKVHGSIDWFGVGNGIVRSDIYQRLEDFVPQIITPGVEKYQRALKEPYRTVLAGADKALSSASAFLCIGYGFNDEHIQEKLIERVTRHSKPICILAKNLTPATKDFISGLKNTEYFAAEESDQGTIAYTNEYAEGIEIKDKNIWALGDFLKWSIDR